MAFRRTVTCPKMRSQMPSALIFCGATARIRKRDPVSMPRLKNRLRATAEIQSDRRQGSSRLPQINFRPSLFWDCVVRPDHANLVIGELDGNINDLEFLHV